MRAGTSRLEGRKLNKKRVIEKFGLDPDKIGIEPFGWVIVTRKTKRNFPAWARVGDLVVQTRDRVQGCFDPEPLFRPNFRGWYDDADLLEFGEIGRCYVFRPASPIHKPTDKNIHHLLGRGGC